MHVILGEECSKLVADYTIYDRFYILFILERRKHLFVFQMSSIGTHNTSCGPLPNVLKPKECTLQKPNRLWQKRPKDRTEQFPAISCGRGVMTWPSCPHCSAETRKSRRAAIDIREHTARVLRKLGRVYHSMDRISTDCSPLSLHDLCYTAPSSRPPYVLPLSTNLNQTRDINSESTSSIFYYVTFFSQV